jgi:urease accessory protein
VDAWTHLQLADSALPTGGFSHSGGLEAAMQLGQITGPEGLAAFVEEATWAAGGFALPFLRAAHADPAALPGLDARCDAATVNHVANQASRVQGRAFLRAASALSAEAGRLEEALHASRSPGHLAPVFGAALRLLGAGEQEAAHLFLFTSARGILSAGVRLGLCGPLESQGLLATAGAAAGEVLARCRSRDPLAAAATAPLLDLQQSHQDRLYSRLFQS